MEQLIQNIYHKYKNLSKEDEKYYENCNKLSREIQNLSILNRKDKFVIDNLIKFNLDFGSILAYLLAEHNVGLENLEEDIKLMVENLKQIETNVMSTSFEQEAEMIRMQFIAMCRDIRTLIIKLVLVIYDAKNCKLPLSLEDKEFLYNVRNIYAPLAERLGYNTVKSELEDICLEFLDPEIFNLLKENVLLKKEENAKQIEITKNNLEQILKELNLPYATITARQKHFSSIYKKIQAKNLSLGSIYDLIAMRVIVNTMEECYAVLGKIHGIYRPMEGRFKDYIANPKPNGYQSIHTTIIVENNRPMEVQIRTEYMHQNAEFGVNVAHWIYKEKRKTTELDKKMAWLRQILDDSANLNNGEFIQTLKTNLYSGRIFVQTPKGKVLEFPDGANLIDFAYAIHSGVGNKCVGGKVNGKMVPLNTKLKRNDVVEIITSPNSKGPSRDWLAIVKTSEARDKINAFFKKELKEENIKNGKQILEIAIKNKGLSVSKILDESILQNVVAKYAFNTADELYSALGYGSVSTNQILNKLITEYEKTQAPKQEKTINNLVIKRNKDGVLVDGDSGMLVRYAGCCNPILGEDIVGYISRGRGVTIHSKNCSNLQFLEDERLIDAEWADKTAKYKIVALHITANVADDFISKLTFTFVNLQFAIVEFDSKILGNKYLCKVKIKANNGDNINKLIKDINALENVLEVEYK